MSDHKWHGVEKTEFLATKSNVPPKPQTFRAGATGGGVTYARVHFTGNYGANFCGSYQEHEEQNITKDSAHEIAWSLYGACGHKIYYYDSANRLIDQE